MQVQPKALITAVAATAGALAAAALATLRRKGTRPETGGEARAADDRPRHDAAVGKDEGPIRPAGPEGMRDRPQRPWEACDEASDESFPASDPPGKY